jgi:hypothetical protein
VGSTPTIDIGAVKGDAELAVKRTMLDIYAGAPLSLIKKFSVQEDISLKVTGIEWNVNNLAYLLSAGITTMVGVTETFEFGGDSSTTSYAARYLHRQPDGSTIDVQLFTVFGKGELNVAFKEKDTHEFPMEFQAVEGTVDFSNVALATSKKKFKIVRTKA